MFFSVRLAERQAFFIVKYKIKKHFTIVNLYGVTVYNISNEIVTA